MYIFLQNYSTDFYNLVILFKQQSSYGYDLKNNTRVNYMLM